MPPRTSTPSKSTRNTNFQTICMNRIYANERPDFKEAGRSVNPVTQSTLLNFDIQEEKESSQGKFSYLQVELMPAQMNKPAIVNAVIRAKYEQPDMEAIQNNYMLNPADEEASADFFEMQEWRKMAKAIAKEALEDHE